MYFIAPGRSALNRVERIMAPLTKELSGVILPHEKYGHHPDEQGRTINVDLERRNFEYAGLALCEIRQNVTIHGHPVVAQYIDPKSSEMPQSKIQKKDEDWISRHVRTSQYFTQVVKCNDLTCYTAPRSAYFSIVPIRFLPDPIPIVQTNEGLEAPNPPGSKDEQKTFLPLFSSLAISKESILPASILESTNHQRLPYDQYCPSVQSVLKGRICKDPDCGLYFASKVMLNNHRKIHMKTKNRTQNASLDTDSTHDEPTDDATAETQTENVVQETTEPTQRGAKSSTAPSKRIRPIRIAAQRQREMMAIIANTENGQEDVEWIDEEDLDLTGVTIPEDNDEHLTPVISISKHLSSPWVDDD